MNKVLAAALWYARQGWYVFPCRANRKEPATTNGFLDASRDDATIRQWFTSMPDANIGIACEPSGIVVVDVDTKNAGESTFDALRSELPREIFETVTALTPSGGQHLVYATDGTRVSSGAHVLGQGIDIRAVGGYIVAAPSVVDGKEYTWEAGYSPRDISPLMWPDELAAKIVRKTTAAPLETSGKIAPGERNATLTSIAGTLRRRGLDFDEIVAALQVVNLKRCDPELPMADVDRIAKSVARYAPEEVIGAIEREQREPAQIDIASAFDVFSEIHNRYDENYFAFSFGVKKLDEKIGGMTVGQVTVLAARSGLGKTAFAEHIISHAGREGKVLFFSLEMSRRRILERMAARHEAMEIKAYRAAGRPMDDTRWLKELDLHFVDKSNKVTIDDIEDAVQSFSPQLVLIDHARHIKGWLATDGKVRADISPLMIMQRLTMLAEQRNIHVVLLSQCSRGADGSRPMLSDLRDSGGVEENADNVIFLHRPFEYGDPEGGLDDVVEILVRKSREGGKGTIHMAWQGEHMRFIDFDPSAFNLQYTRCCSSGEKAARRRGA